MHDDHDCSVGGKPPHCIIGIEPVPINLIASMAKRNRLIVAITRSHGSITRQGLSALDVTKSGLEIMVVTAADHHFVPAQEYPGVTSMDFPGPHSTWSRNN